MRRRSENNYSENIAKFQAFQEHYHRKQKPLQQHLHYQQRR